MKLRISKSHLIHTLSAFTASQFEKEGGEGGEIREEIKEAEKLRKSKPLLLRMRHTPASPRCLSDMQSLGLLLISRVRICFS